MTNLKFEIRLCESCGLRYPLMEDHKFGVRCPHCLGTTRIALKKELRGDQEFRARRSKTREISVLLDNIRSAWNVGSILRSADGFGFSHAYLCGITPTPEQEAVQKTALGADEYVTWSYHKDAVKLVKGLKKEGWLVWALEEAENAKEIGKSTAIRAKNKIVHQTVKQEPIVLIAGSEVTGVDPDLLVLSDETLAISMRGRKRSFNVAVAFGIAAYALA